MEEFQLANRITKLAAGESVTVRNCNSMEALEALAEDAEDAALRTAIAMAKQYGQQMSGLLGQFEAVTVAKEQSISEPRIMFSTVHQAKGGQWPTVVLWDDFADVHCRDSQGRLKLPYEDELNLVYVAVTRAQNILYVNSSIEQVWEAEHGGNRLVVRDVPLEPSSYKIVPCSSCGCVDAKLDTTRWLKLTPTRLSLKRLISSDSIICDGCAKEQELEMYAFAKSCAHEMGT